MNAKSVVEMHDRYVIGNYKRFGVVFVRGQGSYLWDASGKRYLDMLPGLGVGAMGHCHPKVVAAIQDQAARLIHVHNNYYWEGQGLLARELVKRSFPGKAFFCNSGTEATECALKLARLRGAKEGRTNYVSLDNSFHGRTFGGLSVTGQTRFHKDLQPMLPGCSYVPFNDLAALERATDAKTAAVIVEPVQGEGGIFPLTADYLKSAREITRKAGALLVYDEVQSGMGRTGSMFAYQALGGPPPDIMTLAKPLAGGLPAGAVIATDAVAEALVPGTHGTTFGGSPLVCAAALAVLQAIDAERLLENVRAVAPVLGQGLARLKEKHAGRIVGIRQCGLMVGVDLSGPSKDVVTKCLDLGLLVNSTHEIVVRFLPAINISADQIAEGLSLFDQALEATR